MAHQEIPLLHLLKSLITQLMMSLVRGKHCFPILHHDAKRGGKRRKMITGVEKLAEGGS
jgi:hypothetical protein